MKKIAIAISSILLSCGALAANDKQNESLNAIVKINAVYSKPNFLRPWLKNPQSQGSGSGVVIAGNRILTNAHNVADATYITVVKDNNGSPVTAKVEAINHQCDLAILSISDKSFFSDIVPFEIGETPPVQTQVFAIGYPLGGEGLSITQGIISRIELMDYSHPLVNSFLAAQIDAALNPGNSGGPVVFDGKIVGIAFQGAGNGLGYMIHTEIIKHFLKDLENGKIDGFGDIQAKMIGLENPDTRRFLKMKKNQSGILLVNLQKIPALERKLQKDDVILEIDGNKVMNNGNIRTSDGSTRFFTTVIHSKQINESIKLKILRNGEEKEISIFPIKHCNKVIPRMYDKTPSMFTVGGLVFTSLSISYLDEWGENQPPSELLEQYGKDKTAIDEEVVILTEVLGDEVNLGYQGFSNMVLEEVNGKKILNLKDLVRTVDNLKDEFITFKFKDKNQITLDLKKAKSALSRIMSNYGLPADRSKDLVEDK